MSGSVAVLVGQHQPRLGELPLGVPPHRVVVEVRLTIHIVQPGSATVIARGLLGRRRPAAVSAMTVTGSSVPGDPVTATLTSPVRLSPGSLAGVIPNGSGVSAPAPMTRSVAGAPASLSPVASTVTLMTCSAARTALPGEQIGRLDPSDPHDPIVARRSTRRAPQDGKSPRVTAGPSQVSRKNSSERLVKRTLSSVVFRNMSSEQSPASRRPRRRGRWDEPPQAHRPDGHARAGAPGADGAARAARRRARR